MFWMARASAAVSCLPDCRVDTRAAMFSAIWVSTGKSVSATLTHRALHPVVINEMLNTAANTILLYEFTFMSALLLIEFLCDLDLWNCRKPRGDSRPRLSGRAQPGIVVTRKTKSPSAEADGDCDCYEDLKLKVSDPSAAYAAFSLACATLRIVLSSKCRPRICSPMGNFSFVSPQGTEIPGMPARSAVTV